MTAFKTEAEDERCSNLAILDTKKFNYTIALASEPGSGNTRTRFLLEKATGFYTTSAYGDIGLFNEGISNNFFECISLGIYYLKFKKFDYQCH